MMRRKGQAAMEFLMTYGWAILVVLIAIAALAAFGVFDVSIAKTDFTGQMIMNKGTALIEAEDGSVEIAFQNGLNTPITLPMTGNITPSDASTDCTGDGTINASILLSDGSTAYLGTSDLIRQGSTFLVKWECNPVGTINLGDKFTASMSFDYINTETGQERTITGNVRGEYE